MDGQRGIARRMVIGLPPDGLTPAWERDFSSFPPAGVILFRRDFRDLEDLRRLTAKLRTLARPRRLFLAMDEEGGWVSQLDGHLVVPPNATLLARGAEPGEIAAIHQVTAERLRALGVDWVYAPVADVNVEPRNPVIGARAFGSDPERVTRAIGEALAGLRAGGVASCLKHFPGHGNTAIDSHLALPVCGDDRATLDARAIAPFRAHPGASSIMTAHVVYPALDAASPATFSRAIVADLLRGDLGYAGLCVTDALEMKGAAEGRPPAEVGRLALEAGCDLLLYAFHSEEVRRARLVLADALVDGRIPRANFDASRPRLAAFDHDHPEPAPGELAKPLESLTPAGWVERLERLVARGLEVRGGLPAGARGPWHISEPEFARGGTLASRLAAEGVALTGDPELAAVRLVAVASRVPLAPERIASLRSGAREKPTVLLGLQNDAFLDDVPEAAVRVSAADATELTRRVVARRVAELARSTTPV